MSHEPFTQEPDRVPVRVIFIIGFSALVVFVLGAVWSTSVQRGLVGSIHQDTAAPAAFAGKLEVGIVYQTPFQASTIADDKNAHALRHIEGQGPSTPDGGTVAVPITQAMKTVAAGGKL